MRNKYLDFFLGERVALLVLCTTLITGCQEHRPGEEAVTARRPVVQVIRPENHRELETIFAGLAYDWGSVESGVPPLIMERLPGDLDRISPVAKKKRLFFLALLPMVLMANEEVLQQREALQSILARHDAGEALTGEEQHVVEALMKEYALEVSPLTDRLAREKLLRRIDIVPPSLVLAQAATESAYGSSRFAREGNNLFGQWTFVPGTGMIPKRRPPGATYEVRRYPSVYASLKSYLKNLNTHRAYRPLREQRAHLRAADQPLRGHDLARGLLRYSERREAYVRDLRAIIRRNHLSRLSQAELRSPSATASDGEDRIDRSPYSRSRQLTAPETAASPTTG